MNTPPDFRRRCFLVGVRTYAVVLLGLHLVARALPEDRAWGIWPYSMLPLAVQIGGVVLASILLVPAVHRRLETGWRRLGAFGPGAACQRGWGQVGKGWRYALLAGLAAIPFWFGRIVHTRWGDAYILTHAIPHPSARLTYTWQAPLDVFLHAKLWTLTHAWWGWDAMLLYHVVSVMAGVAFLFVLFHVAEGLGRTPLEERFLFGAIASLGMMQLFFGYIENYTLIPLGILAFLWLGVRFGQGRAPLWAVSLTLALTNAFHPSTLVLWPAALSLLRSPRLVQEGRWRSSRTWGELLLPPLLVGAGVLALMESGGHGLEALLGADFPGGGDRRWLVPLSRAETRWEHYTLFSPGHLLDIANEQLLIAPFTLALLVLTYLFLRPSPGVQDPAERFLGVAGLCYLGLTLVWNPDYGGRRDWDLFAPAALPLTMWMAYALPRRLRDPEVLRQTAWAVIPTSLIHLAGWVYSNTLPWSW